MFCFFRLLSTFLFWWHIPSSTIMDSSGVLESKSTNQKPIARVSFSRVSEPCVRCWLPTPAPQEFSVIMRCCGACRKKPLAWLPLLYGRRKTNHHSGNLVEFYVKSCTSITITCIDNTEKAASTPNVCKGALSAHFEKEIKLLSFGK